MNHEKAARNLRDMCVSAGVLAGDDHHAVFAFLRSCDPLAVCQAMFLFADDEDGPEMSAMKTAAGDLEAMFRRRMERDREIREKFARGAT